MVLAANYKRVGHRIGTRFTLKESKMAAVYMISESGTFKMNRRDDVLIIIMKDAGYKVVSNEEYKKQKQKIRNEKRRQQRQYEKENRKTR